jgi:Trypsin-co-occurring domain 1
MGEQARLIRLPDGTEVWARLSPVALPEGSAADEGDEGYGDYEDVGALDSAAARVLRLRDLITGVAASVRDAAERAAPDEVSVEFGVEFAVKAGAVVSVLADAEASSGLKVTLTWRDRFGPAREQPAVRQPADPAGATVPAPAAGAPAAPTVPPPAGAADA